VRIAGQTGVERQLGGADAAISDVAILGSRDGDILRPKKRPAWLRGDLLIVEGDLLRRQRARTAGHDPRLPPRRLSRTAEVGAGRVKSPSLPLSDAFCVIPAQAGI
jgi:hypothetical protein